MVRSTPDAIELQVFDRSRPATNLANWVGYAQKEAVRVETEGNFGVMLPFDIRGERGDQVSLMIERKRDTVLGRLRGPERYKVFRDPKPT